jgi:uncharacterized protein (DUF488 family)
VSLSIWTVGHSTRSADEFRALLAVHEIEIVVDVRRFPGSRRLPHFAAENLEHDLAKANILYRWIAELGCRRRGNPASANLAWRHAAFRAYADHIASEEFADGINELLMLAGGLRTAIMCAEVLWWRCHRRLVADVLTSLGYEVRHIRDASEAEVHGLAPPAAIVDGVLTYALPVRQIELALE